MDHRGTYFRDWERTATMQVNKKMVVLGSINIDHVLQVTHFPRPGETLSGKHYQMTFGGKGANQAVAAGRSGASVTFMACVGEDDVGPCGP